MKNAETTLRLGLPKGRMQGQVIQLMSDAGLPVSVDERGYRPKVGNGSNYAAAGASLRWEAKLLKPQNIVEMLASGSRDIGFAGADWVKELDADLVELFDTALDPVSVVVVSTGRSRWRRCGKTAPIACPALRSADSAATRMSGWVAIRRTSSAPV